MSEQREWKLERDLRQHGMSITEDVRLAHGPIVTQTVARIDGNRDKDIANAYKIRAALEMYDALKFARTYIGICAGSDPDAFAYLERVKDAIDTADGKGETE